VAPQSSAAAIGGGEVSALVGQGAAEVAVGEERYLVAAGRFPGSTPEQGVAVVASLSLDDALAASRELVRLIRIIAGLGLVLATALAAIVTRRLTRPVRRLVEHTEEIARGTLQPHEVRGPTELVVLGRAMNRMVGELSESRALLATNERLEREREMEIARRIQTCILPGAVDVRGLELAASMVPATEVGGDYYDVVPDEYGAWIAIGDVAGHGVQAGVVMMMQSAVAALCPEGNDRSPSKIVRRLNQVLHQNIRERMQQDEHVTFTLFYFGRDGTLRFAGAHEDILLLRRDRQRCELVPTQGTWLGVVEDVDGIIEDQNLLLERGDLVVLYTDGITETPRWWLVSSSARSSWRDEEAGRQRDDRARSGRHRTADTVESLQHDALDASDVDEREGQRACTRSVDDVVAVPRCEAQEFLSLTQLRPWQRAAEQRSHEAMGVGTDELGVLHHAIRVAHRVRRELAG
jgi:sigma-B regulation protein RsbU (phosphoserine phosphatase)